MHSPSRSLIAWITAGSFFVFFIFGFADNLKGATIPAIIRDLDFTYTQGGTVLLGLYIGFFIATLFTGLLADIAGNKVVLLVAGACLVVGILGYSSSRAMGLLMASIGILGLGLGAIEVGCNALIVDLHGGQKGRYLNMMSVFHGLGAMLAPLYAGWLLTSGISWRTVYRGALPLVAIMLVYFFIIKYPHHKAARSTGPDLGSLRKNAFTGQMGWFYLLIALYVAVEIGIASWIVEFLQSARLQTVSTSTLALSLFFGLVTAGRFLGSFLVDRIGYLRIMLLAALGALVCVTLGAFGPPYLSLLLPGTGLFLSIIFPTITAAVSDLHQENMGSILGLLFTFAGLGGIVGPWLVGFYADLFGISASFGVVLILNAMMCATLIILLRRRQQSAIENYLPASEGSG